MGQHVGNRQPQSGADFLALASRITPLEWQKNSFNIVSRNADASVFDVKNCDLARITDAQGDRAFVGELHCIGQQIDQNLTQPFFIRMHGLWNTTGFNKMKSQTFLRRLRSDHLHNLIEKFP